MMNSTNPALSIFDLDRTLTRRGTWSPFLVFAARHNAPWRFIYAPLAMGLMLGYTARLMSRQQLKERMHILMIGRRIPEATVFALAEAFADRLLEDGIYAEAIALIRAEQAAGRHVIIASAAHSFYLRSISNRLGIADSVGTQSVWSDAHLVAKVEGANCYGPNKRTMIEAFMQSRGIVRSDVHIRFFSDDISDLPTFDWADEAVAVNPSARLAQHAARSGWCVFDWRNSSRTKFAAGTMDETVEQAKIRQRRLTDAVAINNSG
jgi:HAD superfamily hydrolase (TIGR01490 family)